MFQQNLMATTGRDKSSSLKSTIQTPMLMQPADFKLPANPAASLSGAISAPKSTSFEHAMRSFSEQIANLQQLVVPSATQKSQSIVEQFTAAEETAEYIKLHMSSTGAHSQAQQMVAQWRAGGANFVASLQPTARSTKTPALGDVGLGQPDSSLSNGDKHSRAHAANIAAVSEAARRIVCEELSARFQAIEDVKSKPKLAPVAARRGSEDADRKQSPVQAAQTRMLELMTALRRIVPPARLWQEFSKRRQRELSNELALLGTASSWRDLTAFGDAVMRALDFDLPVLKLLLEADSQDDAEAQWASHAHTLYLAPYARACELVVARRTAQRAAAPTGAGATQPQPQPAATTTNTAEFVDVTALLGGLSARLLAEVLQLSNANAAAAIASQQHVDGKLSDRPTTATAAQPSVALLEEHLLPIVGRFCVRFREFGRNLFAKSGGSLALNFALSVTPGDLLLPFRVGIVDSLRRELISGLQLDADTRALTNGLTMRSNDGLSQSVSAGHVPAFVLSLPARSSSAEVPGRLPRSCALAIAKLYAMLPLFTLVFPNQNSQQHQSDAEQTQQANRSDDVLRDAGRGQVAADTHSNGRPVPIAAFSEQRPLPSQRSLSRIHSTSRLAARTHSLSKLDHFDDEKEGQPTQSQAKHQPALSTAASRAKSPFAVQECLVSHLRVAFQQFAASLTARAQQLPAQVALSDVLVAISSAIYLRDQMTAWFAAFSSAFASAHPEFFTAKPTKPQQQQQPQPQLPSEAKLSAVSDTPASAVVDAAPVPSFAPVQPLSSSVGSLPPSPFAAAPLRAGSLGPKLAPLAPLAAAVHRSSLSGVNAGTPQTTPTKAQAIAAIELRRPSSAAGEHKTQTAAAPPTTQASTAQPTTAAVTQVLSPAAEKAQRIAMQQQQIYLRALANVKKAVLDVLGRLDTAIEAAIERVVAVHSEQIRTQLLHSINDLTWDRKRDLPDFLTPKISAASPAIYTLDVFLKGLAADLRRFASPALWFRVLSRVLLAAAEALFSLYDALRPSRFHFRQYRVDLMFSIACLRSHAQALHASLPDRADSKRSSRSHDGSASARATALDAVNSACAHLTLALTVLCAPNAVMSSAVTALRAALTSRAVAPGGHGSDRLFELLSRCCPVLWSPPYNDLLRPVTQFRPLAEFRRVGGRLDTSVKPKTPNADGKEAKSPEVVDERVLPAATSPRVTAVTSPVYPNDWLTMQWEFERLLQATVVRCSVPRLKPKLPGAKDTGKEKDERAGSADDAKVAATIARSFEFGLEDFVRFAERRPELLVDDWPSLTADEQRAADALRAQLSGLRKTADL